MIFHGFYILSTRPLIVSLIGDIYISGSSAIDMTRNGQKYLLPEWFRPSCILEHIGGWSVPLHRMGKYKIKQTLYAFCGRPHRLIVNALDEERVRKRFFVRGGHFTSSLYINENLYKPAQEKKLYDAVYTAQLKRFKRHALAKNVEKLSVISYGGNLHDFCPELRHAEFNRSFLSREDVSKMYCQSYSGLCLSAIEGAMFASCEYLLCGIPVVSTPSKGGRDEFFTPENSIIVPPEADAVATAVEYWKTHVPDPAQIREEALNHLNSIRFKYCQFVSHLIESISGEVRDVEDLMQLYFSPSEGMTSRFVDIESMAKLDLSSLSLD